MSGPFLVRPHRLALLDLVDGAVARAAARATDAPLGGGLDRRAFLATLARTSGTALAAAYGASLLGACGSHGPDAAQGLLRSAQRRNELVERWLFRHTSMDHARASAVSAGAGFPTYHVAPAVPTWDPQTLGAWALAVTGRVARPQRLTLADLQRLPHIAQRVDHYCVEGWNAVATWQGVRVRDLAALAGADPAARYVDFRSFDVEMPDEPADDAKRDPATKTATTGAVAPAAGATGDTSADRGKGANAPTNAGGSADGAAADSTDDGADDAPDDGVPTAADLRAGRDYHECWDVESALHPQTLVTYAMDGHLLDAAHGAPARLHSPVKLGYKNTKYLTAIVFRTDRTGGYWSDQGYEWYGGT
ncbi:MAG TPA: molybdopterin-dependent oxidoreductase [Gemmatirosa sp.]